MNQGGRTALITGASSGVGEATAVLLAARGYRVICAARRMDRLERLAERLAPACFPMYLDVGDLASVDSLMERLPADLRAIDVLLNNAGQDEGGMVRFDEGQVDDWTRTVLVNFAGLVRVTHAVIPAMVKRGRGDIVNLGSITSRQASPKLAVYAATKHAVHGFSESLRAEYAAIGLRVIEVVPGVVRSEFALHRWRGDQEAAAAFYDAFPAPLLPEDVAGCIAWALELPPRVNIDQIVVTPTFQ
jgi:3-hydroxy acid dehydrogenase/malonic semialdehyde reductase